MLGQLFLRATTTTTPLRQRGALSRVLGLALLLACSTTEDPSGVVLAINTNDLVIAVDEFGDDTNLLGLYLRHTDAEGRPVATQAFEAAPLRTPEKVLVPFPATLSVQPRHGDEGKGDRLHVRLIAFGPGRVPLAMREARMLVSQERAQLLPLNLFYSNQNVIDLQPEAAPIQSSDPPEVAFTRFAVRCNGGPAAEGQTSDDRGACIPLDVPESELLPFDPAKPVPGADPQSDTCFDVAQAYVPGADLVRVEKSELPPEGACTVSLPTAWEADRVNAALLTREPAFANSVYPGQGLQPLANGVAFDVAGDGRSLTLPPAVCDLARREAVSALLVSARSGAWRGGEAVCSAWNLAVEPREVAGPPGGEPDSSVPPEPDASIPPDAPTRDGGFEPGQPRDDGGPDAGVEGLQDFVVDSTPTVQWDEVAIAGRDGAVLVLGAQQEPTRTLRSYYVANHTVPDIIAVPGTLPHDERLGLEAWAVPVAGQLRFYARVRHASETYSLQQFDPATLSYTQSVGASGSIHQIVKGQQDTYLATLSGIPRIKPMVGAEFAYQSGTPPTALGVVGALNGELLVMTTSQGVSCPEPAGPCTPFNFSGSPVSLNPHARLVSTGTALLTPTDGGLMRVKKVADQWSRAAMEMPEEYITKTVATDGLVCWLGEQGSLRIACSFSDETDVLAPRTIGDGTFDVAAINADENRLYVAYVCSATWDTLRFASVPWTLVRETIAAPNPALVQCPELGS